MALTLQDLPFLPQNKWLSAFIIFVVFLAVAKIIHFIFRKLAEKTPTKADDIILENTGSAFFALLAAIGLRLAFDIVEITDKIAVHLVDSATILLGAFVAAAVIDVLIEEFGKKIVLKTKSTLDEQFLPLIHWSVKAVIIIITAIIILKEWQLDITPLLAGLGIAGLVIGLALKPTLENVLGGVSMVFDKNLKVGDVIQLDSEEIGTVNDIGFRSTKLITPDGEYIIMPNGMLAQLKMKNLTLPVPSVRVVVDFGVEYGSDISKIKKIVGNLFNGADGILTEPHPEVFLTEMGDSALKFRAFFWIHDLKERFHMKDMMTAKIYEALSKEKINVPFPTRTVYLKKK